MTIRRPILQRSGLTPSLLDTTEEGRCGEQSVHSALFQASLQAVLAGRACLWTPRSDIRRAECRITPWLKLISNGVDDVSRARMKRALRDAAARGEKIVMLDDLLRLWTSNPAKPTLSEWFTR